jgi:leader peptidase (prepilin peptidase)/N-methyltransferase
VSDALFGALLDLAQRPAALAAGCGALGLIVGSFLNVVVHRLPLMLEREWQDECARLAGREPDGAARLGLSAPRSRCPACGAGIRWHDNVPIVSWLLLGGRCRDCAAPISRRYPATELAAGLLAAACALRFGPGLPLAAALVLSWSLLALALIDWDAQLLPDDITLPLMWLGLAASLWHVTVGPREAIVGAAVGYLALWLVFHAFKALTGKEGFGYGDFKLLAACGAWFGAASILPIVLVASLSGALVHGSAVLLGRGAFSDRIAFGVYLCPAAWLYLMWGEATIAAWLAYTVRLG